MGRLTNSKKIKLLRIEKARIFLKQDLENGLITEEDVIGLFNKDVNYGINKKQIFNKKEKLLKDIFNCPFLLCDQDVLSQDLKKVLPVFLSVRYNIEKEMLDFYYKQGYLNEIEYNKELDELEFCYYKSSKDGKNILKTGCVVGIKNNIIR